MPGLGGTRLLGFVLLAVAFGVGALAGAAVERVLGAEEAPVAGRDGDRGDRRDRPHVIDRIDLSPEQRQAIDAILERRSERMRAVWREVEPRMHAIADSVRDEIADVLTPDQRAEYEQRLQEWRDRRSRGGWDKKPSRDPAGGDGAAAKDGGDGAAAKDGGSDR